MAAARVKSEVADDHDRIKAKAFAALESAVDRGMAGTDKDGCDAKHLGIAVKAAAEWLTKSGAAAPTASKVTVSAMDLTQLSDEEFAAVQAIYASAKGKAP